MLMMTHKCALSPTMDTDVDVLNQHCAKKRAKDTTTTSKATLTKPAKPAATSSKAAPEKPTATSLKVAPMKPTTTSSKAAPAKLVTTSKAPPEKPSTAAKTISSNASPKGNAKAVIPQTPHDERNVRLRNPRDPQPWNVSFYTPKGQSVLERARKEIKRKVVMDDAYPAKDKKDEFNAEAWDAAVEAYPELIERSTLYIV